jgi:hypothetical protein
MKEEVKEKGIKKNEVKKKEEGNIDKIKKIKRLTQARRYEMI